ncbi:MAG TPA: hypothetical protein VKV40_07035 [Ktedonobacteraceae bacterium]|nr:hypothetical protein [Ktedonobacteraceae bacterium]
MSLAASGSSEDSTRASNGRNINADLNAAYNIIRKVAPNAFGSEGVEDGRKSSYVVHPSSEDCRSPHEAKESK